MPLTSRASSVSLIEYVSAVADLVRPVLAKRDCEKVELAHALGRTSAAAVRAPINLPPFDNSQMDGYAVRSIDEGERLVVQPIPAGRVGLPLHEGEAAPIMTGAPIPPGADAVVPVELVPGGTGVAGFGEPGQRLSLPSQQPGTYVRSVGSDVKVGEVVLEEGQVLTPSLVGMLAALGLKHIDVFRRLRVAVVSTGDELAEPGDALKPGQIYASNTLMLAAALQEAGAEPILLPPSTDEPHDVLALVERIVAGGEADLIVSSGGISKGAREVIRLALRDSLTFLSVHMQPGGPQGFGAILSGTDSSQSPVPFLAFPGNPVSGLISFEMFLRPLLAGRRQRLWLPLSQTITSPQEKHQVRRARITADGQVALVGGPSSHLLGHLAHSTALVHIPAGVDSVTAGELVEVWML